MNFAESIEQLHLSNVYNLDKYILYLFNFINLLYGKENKRLQDSLVKELKLLHK